MDKNVAKQIAEDTQKALESVAAKYGVTVTVRGGTFDAGMFKPRVEFRAPESRRSDFERYARMFGVDPQAFGKTFNFGGTTYRVAGIRPSAHKRPILAAREDGKSFAFSVDILRLIKGDDARQYLDKEIGQ